ncbi:uncharacterized protein LOC123511172 isoform X2 [Portunus trituberculatus]|nr:uncharacterized protein LOC123511172 isoform X2 [Portunus trituberculatus]
MSAPTNTMPGDTAKAAEDLTTDADSDDIFNVVGRVIPLIRDTIKLFGDGAGTQFRGVNTATDLSFRDSPSSSRDDTPPGAVGNVNGFDSPFVPNYVIPGYTIPGNSFTPDIHIPEIHIS